MHRFALDVLGTRGIDLRLQADDCEEQRRTSSDFRRQLYLIFKEAVNNAARYSACTAGVSRSDHFNMPGSWTVEIPISRSIRRSPGTEGRTSITAFP
jgi:hypothetical protein